MKFDDHYDPSDREYDMVFASSESPCWHCGEMTGWIEINFEAYLCSTECVDTKWAEFISAYKKIKKMAGTNDDEE